MLYGLLQNAAVMVSAAVLYALIAHRFRGRRMYSEPAQGLLFGLVSITAMSVAVTVAPGVIFDTRAAILANCALFLGPIGALVSGALAAAYRLWLGGAGAPVGVLNVVIGIGGGLILRAVLRGDLERLRNLHLILMGLGVAVVAVASFALLPIPFEGVVLKQLAPVYIAATVGGALLLGWLMQRLRTVQRIEAILADKDHRFRLLFEQSTVAILEEDLTETAAVIERWTDGGKRDLASVLDADPAKLKQLADTVRITRANPAALHLFGASSLGKLTELMAEPWAPENMAAWRRAVINWSRGADFFQGRLRFLRVDGESFPATISLPLPSRDGSCAGVPVTITDLTELDRKDAEVRRTTQALASAAFNTVGAVAKTIEKRDPYTAGHQARVAELAVAIAERMNWSVERIEGLRLGAMVHDIGKVSIPAEILSRPGRLTPEEMAIMRTHAAAGADILGQVQSPWPLREMVEQHHERLDGSGYPHGLAGDRILPEARILAVADVVESMTAHRPYRPALGADAALDELRRGRGTLYDPAVVDACLAALPGLGSDPPTLAGTPPPEPPSLSQPTAAPIETAQ